MLHKWIVMCGAATVLCLQSWLPLLVSVCRQACVHVMDLRAGETTIESLEQNEPVGLGIVQVPIGNHTKEVTQADTVGTL